MCSSYLTAYERLGGHIGGLQAVAARDRDIEQLRQQVRRLEAAIANYETSTSWRLTAPLRGIARLMNSANRVAGDLRDRLHDAASPSPSAPAAPIYRADH